MQMYRDYFQKSKVFFYPLLGIPKGTKYVPVGTYLSWEDEIDLNDKKFMCIYKQREGKMFRKFEDKYLLGNILFDDYSSCIVYGYDYSHTLMASFDPEWTNSMKAYTKFSCKPDKII